MSERVTRKGWERYGTESQWSAATNCGLVVRANGDGEWWIIADGYDIESLVKGEEPDEIAAQRSAEHALRRILTAALDELDGPD